MKEVLNEWPVLGSFKGETKWLKKKTIVFYQFLCKNLKTEYFHPMCVGKTTFELLIGHFTVLPIYFFQDTF